MIFRTLRMAWLSAPPFKHIPQDEDEDMEESIHSDANQGSGQGIINAPDEVESSRWH